MIFMIKANMILRWQDIGLKIIQNLFAVMKREIYELCNNNNNNNNHLCFTLFKITLIFLILQL